MLQFLYFSVYANLRVTALAHLVKELTVMAFSAPYQRGQKITLAACILGKDKVHNLGVCVSHHFAARFRGKCTRTFGVQKAQEIIYFRNGSNRASGIVPGGLLLYGNDWAKACYLLHLRLFQNAHEVLGIGAQCIHVAALPLGIDSIESQRTFAAAAETGHNHKFPPGDIYAYVLQVVSPRPPHLYVLLLCHRLQRYKEKWEKPAPSRERFGLQVFP